MFCRLALFLCLCCPFSNLFFCTLSCFGPLYLFSISRQTPLRFTCDAVVSQVGQVICQIAKQSAILGFTHIELIN